IGFTLLHQVMPAKTDEALAALGLTLAESPLVWGGWKYDRPLGQGVNLFPRSANKEGPEAKGGADAASRKGSGEKGSGKPQTPAPADPFSLIHLKVALI